MHGHTCHCNQLEINVVVASNKNQTLLLMRIVTLPQDWSLYVIYLTTEVVIKCEGLNGMAIFLLKLLFFK